MKISPLICLFLFLFSCGEEKKQAPSTQTSSPKFVPESYTNLADWFQKTQALTLKVIPVQENSVYTMTFKKGKTCSVQRFQHPTGKNSEMQASKEFSYPCDSHPKMISALYSTLAANPGWQKPNQNQIQLPAIFQKENPTLDQATLCTPLKCEALVKGDQ